MNRSRRSPVSNCPSLLAATRLPLTFVVCYPRPLPSSCGGIVRSCNQSLRRRRPIRYATSDSGWPNMLWNVQRKCSRLASRIARHFPANLQRLQRIINSNRNDEQKIARERRATVFEVGHLSPSPREFSRLSGQNIDGVFYFITQLFPPCVRDFVPKLLWSPA